LTGKQVSYLKFDDVFLVFGLISLDGGMASSDCIVVLLLGLLLLEYLPLYDVVANLDVQLS
jgi:hypothetical protein